MNKEFILVALYCVFVCVIPMIITTVHFIKYVNKNKRDVKVYSSKSILIISIIVFLLNIGIVFGFYLPFSLGNLIISFLDILEVNYDDFSTSTTSSILLTAVFLITIAGYFFNLYLFVMWLSIKHFTFSFALKVIYITFGISLFIFIIYSKVIIEYFIFTESNYNNVGLYISSISFSVQQLNIILSFLFAFLYLQPLATSIKKFVFKYI